MVGETSCKGYPQTGQKFAGRSQDAPHLLQERGGEELIDSPPLTGCLMLCCYLLYTRVRIDQ